MLAAFQSPEDFTVKEQTLEYSNGDSYQVWLVARRAAGHTSISSPSLTRVGQRCLYALLLLLLSLPHVHLVLLFFWQCLISACPAPVQGETLGTLRHGRGKHTCSNGDVYDGQWRCAALRCAMLCCAAQQLLPHLLCCSGGGGVPNFLHFC